MPSALPDGIPWPISGQLDFGAIDPDKSFHAYIHIPFCDVRCGYCDFNTYTGTEIGDIKRSDFHLEIVREIELAASYLKSSGVSLKPYSTVFFGGGTPTLFTPAQFDEILVALKNNFGLVAGCEITAEANPDNVTELFMQQLAAVGITRISMGVQSFDTAVLKSLDRSHDPSQVAPAAAAVKKAGMQLSVDLIYGASGETLDSWSSSLQQAISLQPDHISAYALIVEAGTALARRISKGELEAPDDDLQADKYMILDSLLTEAGLIGYELSNWSTSESSQSKHNSAYWRGNYWWGFGPGAHSFVGNTRFWNTKHPLSYKSKLTAGLAVHSFESLTPQQLNEERLLLEIRLRTGISQALLSELSTPKEAIAEQIALGLLIPKDSMERFELSLQGRLLADSVVLKLLS